MCKIMAGGMFAAHYESGGELVEIDGKHFKQVCHMDEFCAV